MEQEEIQKVKELVDNSKEIRDVGVDIQKIEYAKCQRENEQKIVISEIYHTYPWMEPLIALLPSTERKAVSQLNYVDYFYVLEMQRCLLIIYGTGKMQELFETLERRPNMQINDIIEMSEKMGRL